ncbi:MAG: DUF3164 family protein [Flavobacteriaceae bacterium]|jgi:hypothetical protein|nr:DUF3164 family protein [Flavobacteriaceae bacterium]
MEATVNNTVQKPASELSAAELKELLAAKEAEENRLAERRKNDYLKDKNNFLQDLLNTFHLYKNDLVKLKKDGITHATNFNNLKYEIDGKEPKKDAKSFELKNDTIRVVVEEQERFDFTDEAIVHINAIKDIFKAKFEERNKGMYALLDSILMRNTKGDYDAKLLAKARGQVKKIGDEALIAEFDKLQDCLTVVGTSKYIRIYERDPETKKWKGVSLNFSEL